jgi:hypothetical protein
VVNFSSFVRPIYAGTILGERAALDQCDHVAAAHERLSDPVELDDLELAHDLLRDSARDTELGHQPLAVEQLRERVGHDASSCARFQNVPRGLRPISAPLQERKRSGCCSSSFLILSTFAPMPPSSHGAAIFFGVRQV